MSMDAHGCPGDLKGHSCHPRLQVRNGESALFHMSVLYPTSSLWSTHITIWNLWKIKIVHGKTSLFPLGQGFQFAMLVITTGYLENLGNVERSQTLVPGVFHKQITACHG